MNFSVPVSVAIFAFLPALLAARWKLECPPPEEIHPCTCTNFPKDIVRCNDVRNLDAVRKALHDNFNTPLPRLEISNIHSIQLPHHAFTNISAKRLYLKDSNLKWIDDNAFDGQQSLGLLILSDDRLSELPVEALKPLSGLQTLSLAGNFIMRLTKDSFHHLHRLKFLVLDDNRLSKIEQNSFPNTVESLSLSGNLLTSLNGTLEDLSQLEMFFAANNRLTSIKHEFDGLNRLFHINLDFNNIYDIDDGSFDDLVSLKSLNLAYNNLMTIGDGLYSLKNLQNLNLSYNYITELNPDVFKSLNSITTLDVSGNFLKNVCESLKPLRGLLNLRLSNTNLMSLPYDCFQDMRNLRTLDLSLNDLTSVTSVTAHPFPKLLSLNLRRNQLFLFRHGLKNLRNLNELDISENKLRSLKNHHLTHNTQLRTLRIEGNPWDCSDHLMELFHDIESRRVTIEGAPSCYQDANAL